MNIILIGIFLFAMTSTPLELKIGSWTYNDRDIPVYTSGKEYKAYIYKEGVFTLKKNPDNTFSPIKFDNFEDRYESYAEAERWQFNELKKASRGN